jgi:hypothetical protein
VLFKCDWVDSVQDKGFRTDKCGIKEVNFNNLLNSGYCAFNVMSLVS